MNTVEKIPTEILQRFSAFHAWEYRLVPYEEKDGKLLCYADDGADLQALETEAGVMTGERLELIPLESEELSRLLRQYYRPAGEADRTVRLDAGSDRFLMELIGEAYRNGASDIHFEAYEERCRVRFRLDGKLIERYVIEKRNYPAVVNRIKILADLDISEKRLPQDGRIFYRGEKDKFDVRVSSLPTIYGEKVVLRLLTRRVGLLELSNPGFSEKQLEDYIRAVRNPHGLVLISGPTGSGKSTTLYATLRLLNRDTDNILTIEDPVEYTLEGVNQVQLKEEIGLTFGSALRTFLRQDPDIIMLGEIRDSDTARMAVRSALTGHLIFSTIHTNSAWGSVARLVDMGLHPYLVSDTLVLCAAQRLVRLLCPHCKEKAFVDADFWRRFGYGEGPAHGWKAVGCEKCYYTGYRGRRAIYEVIPMDRELSEAVRASRDDMGEELKKRGIVTLRDAALRLLETGETSPEEILPLLEQ